MKLRPTLVFPIAILSGALGVGYLLFASPQVNAPANAQTPPIRLPNVPPQTKTLPQTKAPLLINAPLQTAFDAKGLSLIRYNGVTLYQPSANIGQNFEVYREGATVLPFDRATKTLTWSYGWGRVACKYIPLADRLNLEITITNTSAKTLDGQTIFPLRVDFPGRNPVGFDNDGYHVNFNTDGPAVQTADFGRGQMTVVNPDVKRPLIVGYASSGPETVARHRFGVLVNSYPESFGYRDLNWPDFNRTIAPNSSDTYKISLRFSPSGAADSAIAGDVFAAYAAAHPRGLKWADRRPIGALFLASSAPKTPNNPRGWLNNATDFDVRTPAGRAELNARVLKYADDSIVQLRAANAQGMVTWDIEGSEFGHPTTFIGDPRLVPVLAPEMQPIADAYFRKFRDAGLRTGICIRPQQLLSAPGGTPVVAISAKPNDPTQQDVNDIAGQLLAKIDYARNRWGCTLFYIDSNMGRRNPADAAAFAQIARARPDILLMPEHKVPRYYADSAPYTDFSVLQYESKAPRTPDRARHIYPDAFSVIRLGENEQIDEHRADLIRAVRAGDILMYRAWFPNGEAQRVRDIYAQAKRLDARS